MSNDKKGPNTGCTSIGCLALFVLFSAGLAAEHPLDLLFIVPGFVLLGLGFYAAKKHAAGKR